MRKYCRQKDKGSKRGEMFAKTKRYQQLCNGIRDKLKIIHALGLRGVVCERKEKKGKQNAVCIPADISKRREIFLCAAFVFFVLFSRRLLCKATLLREICL